MNEGKSESSSNASKPKRWRRPLLIGVFLTAIGGAVFASACAGGRGWHGHHWGGHHGGQAMDAQAVTQRAEAFADRMLSKVNATDAQRQQIQGIVKSAVTDLLPLRDQHRAARQEMMTALTQPSIDRAKLETLRSTELQRAEAASRRLVQAIADVAEVLTPEQRSELAKRMAHHRGG